MRLSYGKRRIGNNIGPLLDKANHLTNREVDKVKKFNAFFASVSNSKDGPQDHQSPALEDHDWCYDKLLPNPESVQDLLLQLDDHKSVESNGIHPRVLKELANVTVEPLSNSFQWFGESGEVPIDWKLTNVGPISKKVKKGETSNLQA